MTRSLKWDLEQLFAGGSQSAAFAAFLTDTEQRLNQWKQAVEQTTTLTPEIIKLMQTIIAQLREAGAFTECLEAQNMDDKQAVALSAKVRVLRAAFEGVQVYVDQLMVNTSDADWQALLGQAPFAEVAFALNERRERANQMLPPEQEALLADLAMDGYHGWGDAYNTAVARLRVKVDIDGQEKALSAGQAFNYLHDSDATTRAHVFERWEQAWAEQRDLCADALNHLAGFRLQVYKHRGWDTVLQEPLAINRMQESTLNAIWAAIAEQKQTFVAYLQRKAKLLGMESLQWQDYNAPIGEASKTYAYDEAADLILQQFAKFSPKMAAFSARAFDEGWIEGEDREGKRPGGFCTSLPVAKQTRIFMTYSGTADNVSTLAHELGHAYHQSVMDDLPMLLQDYAMNVAETASTLAELIVMEATIQEADTKEEQLFLLDQKLQSAVAFYMNIHARFLFETRFYAERKQGLVATERLNALMVAAQKEAFDDALESYHPHFWASKLHFYITEVPFYNFPYTFGYLFSAGIYAYAEQTGDFEDKYIALLRDTGSMTVEQLAQKHLGVDLTQPDFWRAAVAYTARDVAKFMALTAEE
jgi:pepF/M3 family oligoendopeptidase